VKNRIAIALLGIFSAAKVFAADSNAPALCLDPAQHIEARIDDLIAHLDLREKGEMLSTTAPAIDRLRIPVFNGWNQCLRGVQWSEPTTLFPCPIGLAASWDTRPSASLTAEQAKAAAMRLANDQAFSLYHCRPFHDGQPAQFVAGHWLWVEQQGFGHSDIQATVELALEFLSKVRVTKFHTVVTKWLAFAGLLEEFCGGLISSGN